MVSEGMEHIIACLSTSVRAGNGFSGWNNVVVGDLPFIFLVGALVSEGTPKIARPVIWPKFFHAVVMGLAQHLVEAPSLEPIGVHAF